MLILHHHFLHQNHFRRNIAVLLTHANELFFALMNFNSITTRTLRLLTVPFVCLFTLATRRVWASSYDSVAYFLKLIFLLSLSHRGSNINVTNAATCTFIRHKMAKHLATVKSNETIQCPVCQKHISKPNIARHMNSRNNPDKKFSCPKCNREFKTKDYAKAHCASVGV